MALTDAGTLVLSGTNNTYTGGTYTDHGTLVMDNGGAMPVNGNLVIGAGGTFLFDPSVGGALLSQASTDLSQPMSMAVSPQVRGATEIGVVPEPGTLVLLLAALGIAAACRRFSKRRATR